MDKELNQVKLESLYIPLVNRMTEVKDIVKWMNCVCIKANGRVYFLLHLWEEVGNARNKR